MGVFDDKKFDGLDWISQATEPMDSRLNEILEQLPDRLHLDFNRFLKICGSIHNLTITSAIYNIVTDTVGDHLCWEQLCALCTCFAFEVEGDSIALDFEKQQITGSIYIVKTATTIDEKHLESILGVEGMNMMLSIDLSVNEAMDRCNEIMSMLGRCEDSIKTRSAYKKRVALLRRVRDLFRSNEWNIKDTVLADKVGGWIASYIIDGNLAALSNFCRLKVMTHKGQAIYSMEEV